MYTSNHKLTLYICTYCMDRNFGEKNICHMHIAQIMAFVGFTDKTVVLLYVYVLCSLAVEVLQGGLLSKHPSMQSAKINSLPKCLVIWYICKI